MTQLAIIPGVHGWEWIILLVLGLLLFGRRLPEVGRSMGKAIVEFKRGVKGVEEEIEAESTKSKVTSARAPLIDTGEDARVHRDDKGAAQPN